MDVLTFETCSALSNEIKNKWRQVGLSLFNYQDDAWLNKYKIPGVLARHPIPQGHTVNVVYCESFQYSSAVKKKHPELVGNANVLSDNATTHSADTAENNLWCWGGEKL